MGTSLIRIALLTTLAACSMYGDPAQRLRSPPPVKPPAGLPGDDGVAGKTDLPYDESECPLRTTVVKSYRPDRTRAEELTRSGDDKLAGVEVAATADDKGDLLAGSIVDYGRALEKDAFSAEVTLKLALAYDKARRKSCALALLRRLHQLAEHPKFERAATEQIDEIVDPKNKSWFEGYRNDARRAVGR